MRKMFILVALCLPSLLMAQKEFSHWPEGSSPKEVGELVSHRFVTVPHPNFDGNPAPPNEITYPETCAWFGALRYAGISGNKKLLRQLEERFLPIFGPERRLQPLPDHVDHTVFGTIPLQLYAQTGKEIYYHMGKWYADAQWELPHNTKHRDEYQALLDQGLSWQTRYWIDDMYMISAVQSQAYHVTKDRRYIDRAANEMVKYLDKIQRPNGLFYHAPDVPFFWGRGNGWMAAGMTELLAMLPDDNPDRKRILASYRTMMDCLRTYQKQDGLWGQLVDDKTSWTETSGSAMFVYAMIKGVKRGWLNEAVFAPLVRKAWISLVGHIDDKGDLAGVCEGTNKTNDRQFYLNRRTLPGNMHGQAPLLWCVNAFLETDDYWSTPLAGPEERKTMFLKYYAERGTKESLTGIFNQIARVAIGLPIEDTPMRNALAVLRSNRDCNDFTLNGMIRLLYMDRQKAVIPAHLKKEIEVRVLDFKYWWDDGRRDTTYRCYHTENHQALYHTAELLAGQLYKEHTFANGMNGSQHMEHAKERLTRWLDFRFRFGFSEWLSTYYEVEAMLLANLYDYAEDPAIRKKAGYVLDLLLFDMALNNYEGMLGSTSGRIYHHSLIGGSHNTSPLSKLMFGVGTFDRDEVMAPIALATSTYQCPKIIQEIAVDYQCPLLNRQRTSIRVEDAPSYGLRYDNELDCHLFWGMQEFIHPLAIRMSKQLSEKYNTWPYRNYDAYIGKYDEQIKTHGRLVNSHLDRFALSEANILTYRTPHYLLSSVQDYRPGAPGYQQHIWQATLGNRALVYTNHPGSKNLRHSPNYWAGNEILPRAAQQQNVVICIYNIPAHEKNDYTHAYFPQMAFDEVVQKGNWTFGRKADGYIALYSRNSPDYRSNDQGEMCDLFASGRKNIWICETGSKKEWKSFEKFVATIVRADVTCGDLDVTYHSPSAGQLSFGWTAPFTVKGKEQSLRGAYRYDNPYCKALFDSRRIEIKKGKEKLILDLTEKD